MPGATHSDPQRPTCRGIRKDSRPCGALGLLDGYCPTHHPDKAEAQREARRKGGRNSAKIVRLSKLMPARLLPVWDQLEQALADVLRGSLDPKQATAAAAVARALATILQVGELEERVRKLEGTGS